MKSHSIWPDPPGYREAVARLHARVPWKVLTLYQKGCASNIATILISPDKVKDAPYQWLNNPHTADP